MHLMQSYLYLPLELLNIKSVTPVYNGLPTHSRHYVQLNSTRTDITRCSIFVVNKNLN